LPDEKAHHLVDRMSFYRSFLTVFGRLVLVLILLFPSLQRQMLEEAKKASVTKKLDRRAERIRYEKVRSAYSFPP
jgi:hypothetical protein